MEQYKTPVFRKRFCDRCGKMFLRDAKSQRICKKCKNKAFRNRKLNIKKKLRGIEKIKMMKSKK